METFIGCALIAHITHIAPVCTAVKAYTTAVTACAVLVYKASLAVWASLAVFNVALQAIMVIALTAFAAAFVATPAVFAKLRIYNTNTAVYTVCSVIHSTFNAHVAVLAPGAITFSTVAANNAPYGRIINKAQTAAGAHHIICKMTFITNMVLSLCTFTITIVAYPAVRTKCLVYLTCAAILTVASIILCTFNTHVTFVAPLISTLMALVADKALQAFVIYKA